MPQARKNLPYRILCSFIAFNIFFSSLLPFAQAQSVLNLPLPGSMVGISPEFVPIVIKGVKVFPDNPFRFEFILDSGNASLNPKELNRETRLLIKYFLTALTVPDDDQWVNLSPYENDRIIPDEFGTTEMGRDLLAQDYLFKQLTASLVYPEHELGKKFWERVYQKAYEKFGTTDIPVSTFNKVWVLPDHARVYEYGTMAVITESHLKVMLEEDYLAFTKDNDLATQRQMHMQTNDDNSLGSQVMREVIIPEIEKEINEGRNFAKLRQIYQSLIMAAWFKRKLKNSILSKMYVGANKVAGVDVEDKEIKQKIYEQYIKAYKKGVYNYVKEEMDESTQEVIPRKYFSGGVVAGTAVDKAMMVTPVNTLNDLVLAGGSSVGESLKASVRLDTMGSTGRGVFKVGDDDTKTDQAMLAADNNNRREFLKRSLAIVGATCIGPGCGGGGDSETTKTTETPQSTPEPRRVSLINGIVEQQSLQTGLIPSYTNTNVAFIYDQALSIISLLNNGHTTKAERIAEFLINEWNNPLDGRKGLATSYIAQTGRWADSLKIPSTSNNIWVGIAAIELYKATGKQKYLQLADNIAQWVKDEVPHSTIENSGGIGIPTDSVDAPNFKGTTVFSTEGNIDYASLLMKLLATNALPEERRVSLISELQGVKQWIKARWNPESGILNRGMNSPNGDGVLVEDKTIKAFDTTTFFILTFGPQVINDEFGIDPIDLVAKAKEHFEVAVNIPGQTSPVRGFDFTKVADHPGFRTPAISIEFTNQAVVMFDVMAKWAERIGNQAKASEYREEAEFYRGEMAKLMFAINNGLGLAYSVPGPIKNYVDGWITPATNVSSIASVTWGSFDFNPMASDRAMLAGQETDIKQDVSSAVDRGMLALSDENRKFFRKVLSDDAIDRHEDALVSIVGDPRFRDNLLNALQILGGNSEKYLPGLIELGKASPRKMPFLFTDAMGDFKDKFKGDIEKYWPDFVVLGVLAKENSRELFKYGFDYVKGLFGEDFESIWPELFEMGKDTKEGVTALFTQGLFRTKLRFEDNFQEYWPVLRKMAKKSGASFGYMLASGLTPELARLVTNSQELEEIGETLLSVGNKYNQEFIYSLFESSRIFKFLESQGADLRAHLDFYVYVLKRHPRLGLKILESLFEAIKGGRVDLKLRDKETIIEFIDKVRGFDINLYQLYQKEGAEALDQVLDLREVVLKDGWGIAELDMEEDGFNKKGFDGKNLVLSVIESAVPTSGASFVQSAQINKAFTNMRAAGDLREHVPEVLRHLGAFGGMDIERVEWTLKDGETLDPDNKVKELVDALRYPDQGKPTEEIEKDFREDRQKAVEALEAYLADQSPVKRQMALEAFYAFVRHNDLLREKVDAFQGDYVGIGILEQLFHDKDSLNVLLQELISKDVNPEFLKTKGTRLITDVGGFVKAVSPILAITDESSRAKALYSFLGKYDENNLRRVVLPEDVRKNIDEVMNSNELSSQLSVSKIVDDLFVEPLRIILNEKSKFTEIKSAEQIKLRFRAVKGIPYGLWGLCAGVCIATDVALWKKKQFYLLAMIDEESQQAVGFIHMFEHVDNKGQKVLTVPGIEPSVEFMGQVSANELYPLMVNALRRVAREAGYAAIYLPTSTNILSNRTDINAIVIKSKYQTDTIPEVDWNTMPQPYKFSDVYVLPLSDEILQTSNKIGKGQVFAQARESGVSTMSITVLQEEISKLRKEAQEIRKRITPIGYTEGMASIREDSTRARQFEAKIVEYETAVAQKIQEDKERIARLVQFSTLKNVLAKVGYESNYQLLKRSMLQENSLGKGRDADVYRIPEVEDYALRHIRHFKIDPSTPMEDANTPFKDMNVGQVVARIGKGVEIVLMQKGSIPILGELRQYDKNSEDYLRYLNIIAGLPQSAFTLLAAEIREVLNRGYTPDDNLGNFLIDEKEKRIYMVDVQRGGQSIDIKYIMMNGLMGNDNGVKPEWPPILSIREVIRKRIELAAKPFELKSSFDRAQLAEQIEERLQLIAQEGILSPLQQREKGISTLLSTDGAVRENNPNIDLNAISWLRGFKEDEVLSRALFDAADGSFQVVLERPDDVEKRLLDLPQAQFEDVIMRRVQNSFIVIIDYGKLNERDQVSVGFGNSGTAGISFANGPIKVDAIKALLVPEILADTVRAIFPSTRVIEVPSIQEEVKISRHWPAGTVNPQTSWQERTAVLTVPNYKESLRTFLNERPVQNVLIHGIRLPTEEDINTPARDGAMLVQSFKDRPVFNSQLINKAVNIQKDLGKIILAPSGKLIVPDALVEEGDLSAEQMQQLEVIRSSEGVISAQSVLGAIVVVYNSAVKVPDLGGFRDLFQEVRGGEYDPVSGIISIDLANNFDYLTSSLRADWSARLVRHELSHHIVRENDRVIHNVAPQNNDRYKGEGREFRQLAYLDEMHSLYFDYLDFPDEVDATRVFEDINARLNTLVAQNVSHLDHLGDDEQLRKQAAELFELLRGFLRAYRNALQTQSKDEQKFRKDDAIRVGSILGLARNLPEALAAVRAQRDLTPERMSKIESFVDEYLSVIVLPQFKDRDQYYFEVSDRMDYLRESLGLAQTPEEIRYLARVLKSKWSPNQKETFGSLFNFVAVMRMEHVGKPEQVKDNFEWVYHFLEEADPLERAQALWTMVLGSIEHLRYLGVHPENEGGRPDVNGNYTPDYEVLTGVNLKDKTVFKGLMQRYILALLDLKKRSEFTDVVYQFQGNKVTNENILKWGLVLLMDPTIYASSRDVKSPEQIRDYWRKHWGEAIESGLVHQKFLELAFGQEDLKARDEEVQDLISEALNVPEETWIQQGFISPYVNTHSIFIGRFYFRNGENYEPYFQQENLRRFSDPIHALAFQNGLSEYSKTGNLKEAYGKAYAVGGIMSETLPDVARNFQAVSSMSAEGAMLTEVPVYTRKPATEELMARIRQRLAGLNSQDMETRKVAMDQLEKRVEMPRDILETARYDEQMDIVFVDQDLWARNYPGQNAMNINGVSLAPENARLLDAIYERRHNQSVDMTHGIEGEIDAYFGSLAEVIRMAAEGRDQAQGELRVLAIPEDEQEKGIIGEQYSDDVVSRAIILESYRIEKRLLSSAYANERQMSGYEIEAIRQMVNVITARMLQDPNVYFSERFVDQLRFFAPEVFLDRNRPKLEENASDVGGIDMNQRALDLQIEGESVSFDIPFDPAQWQNIQFDGFTPVILEITPTSLPVFIGASDAENPIQLSSV